MDTLPWRSCLWLRHSFVAQGRCAHSNVRYSSIDQWRPCRWLTAQILLAQDRCAHSNVRYSNRGVLAVSYRTDLSLKTGVLTATCGAVLYRGAFDVGYGTVLSLKTGVLAETCGTIALPWRPCRWPRHSFARSRQVCSQKRAVRQLYRRALAVG